MLRRKKHKTCAGRQRRGLLNQGGETVYFPKVVTSEMREAACHAGISRGSCSAKKWQESSLNRLKQARNALCVSHISNMEVSNLDLIMQLDDPLDPDFFCVLALPSMALGFFYLVALHFSNLMLQNGYPSLSCHICPTACLTKEALKGDVLSQFQVFS